MLIDECPSRSDTVLSGSSRPPSTRRPRHHDAKKCRKLCRPVYFALPSLSLTPAATCSGHPARLMMLVCHSMPPSLLGNTRARCSSSPPPLAHPRFHPPSSTPTPPASPPPPSPP